jgi:hypothetical protein
MCLWRDEGEVDQCVRSVILDWQIAHVDAERCIQGPRPLRQSTISMILALASIFSYIVLAMQFESVVQPLVIPTCGLIPTLRRRRDRRLSGRPPQRHI